MIRIILLILLSLVIVGGCDRDEQTLRVQQVPKSSPPSTAAATPVTSAAAAEISWTIPPGWTQLPAQQMRFASFQVSADHPDVVLTVIPLGAEAAELLPNINRWEGQLGLPPTPENELHKIVTHVDIAGEHASLAKLVGPETVNPRQAMLAGIVPHGGRVWFFKLMGPADVVVPQEQAFNSFVNSVTFSPGNP